MMMGHVLCHTWRKRARLYKSGAATVKIQQQLNLSKNEWTRIPSNTLK